MSNYDNYRTARSLLRLGPYERWQVTCIVDLLGKHDNRVAADDRRRIARQKSASMLSLQARGRRVSSIAPYGWTPDPMRPWRLIRQPEEQETLQRILREAKAGKSYRAIARGLDAAGVPCRSGRAWSHQVIGAIVRRAGRNGGEV